MKKENKSHSWVFTVAITTFLLSLFFSYISNTAISNLDVIPGIIILILVILIGVLFDLIGVSVTIAKEEEFHARASKKIRGSKTAIKLIRNSAKVSNFCADVIGDIAGVISGAISTMIALKLTESYGMSSSFQFVVSALVASLTVSGKAITKEFAKKNANKILEVITKVINFD
jgi:hypothetical protein